MIQFSTAARVAHDLGLAACLGGTLVPAPEASARAALLQRAVSTLRSVHVALFAGIIALTTVLSAEAVRAARPSVPSRSRY